MWRKLNSLMLHSWSRKIYEAVASVVENITIVEKHNNLYGTQKEKTNRAIWFPLPWGIHHVYWERMLLFPSLQGFRGMRGWRWSFRVVITVFWDSLLQSLCLGISLIASHRLGETLLFEQTHGMRWWRWMIEWETVCMNYVIFVYRFVYKLPGIRLSLGK